MRSSSLAPSIGARLWSSLIWVFVGLFVLNLAAVIATVVVSSLSTRWFGTWLPSGWTTKWYASAWGEFQLSDVLRVTFEASFLVVAISGLVGVPAAYASGW
jgi:putative spermidine/putrescine transport system permease protein